MTALTFSKRVNGMTTCEGLPNCKRKGQRKMFLAGYPLPHETRYGMKRAGLMLCSRCANEAKRIYEGALS